MILIPNATWIFSAPTTPYRAYLPTCAVEGLPTPSVKDRVAINLVACCIGTKDASLHCRQQSQSLHVSADRNSRLTNRWTTVTTLHHPPLDCSAFTQSRITQSSQSLFSPGVSTQIGAKPSSFGAQTSRSLSPAWCGTATRIHSLNHPATR